MQTRGNQAARPSCVLVRLLGDGRVPAESSANFYMAGPDPKKPSVAPAVPRRFISRHPSRGLWLPASEGLLVEVPETQLRSWNVPDTQLAPAGFPGEGIVLQLPPGCLVQVEPQEGVLWSAPQHGMDKPAPGHAQVPPVVYMHKRLGEVDAKHQTGREAGGPLAKLSLRLHDGAGEEGVVKNEKLNFKDLVETAKKVEICKHTGRKSGSSNFLGVSKHRKSGRFEAHVWMPEKRRQIYLGGFSCGMAAACAYDLVALKVKGESTTTNFRNELYQSYRTWIKSISLAEIISHIRRQSRGFSRGHSRFRGVTQHPNGRWEARIGVGTKHHVYLGLYGSQESAAQHYDEALVRLKGESAATNFPLGNYSIQLKENQTMSCQPFLKDGKSSEESKKAAMKWIKYGSRQARITRDPSFCEE